MALKLRYDPKGRAFSPVVRANAKFYCFGCVDVRFQNASQLDDLIEALTLLREFPSDGYNHVHLQDSQNETGSMEVIFWHPSVKRNATDKSCIRSAREELKKLLV